jgi:hypothetical protein|tara:strand:+ start:2106 stop:2399 length:294 start_codon:yes stop_codon:yes gene_type:complete
MGNGYGAIYGSTWWGSQNAINFNEISYYIYAVDQLKTRALADGAVMEGFGCASEAIRTMGDRDTAEELFVAYNTRVVADSGSTEARICTIKEISLLR